MSDKIKIKVDEHDFQFIGAEVLSSCPANKNKEFVDGFLFYTQELFETLEMMTPVLQIDDGYSLIPLDLFISDPLNYLDELTQNLSSFQKKAFLEGFELGMEKSCQAIQLALSIAEDKFVA